MSAPPSPTIQNPTPPPPPNLSPTPTQSSPPKPQITPPASTSVPGIVTIAADGSAVAAAVTTTAAPSTNPRRLPPPCWSHDETVALIDAYRDKWYTLRRGNLKATHWQEVADAVARRCPAASPPKTAVQCRHKMEKLRKRYRAEIQRARSMPISRFSSSWVHFKRMDAMEKGPSAKPDYNSDSPDEDNDEDEEDDLDQDLYDDMYKNGGGVVNTRSMQRLYNRNGIVGGGGSSSSGGTGFRIRIPTGVSIAQPGPRFYGKIDQKYAGISNSNANSSPNSNPKVGFGAGSNYATKVLRGCEEMGRSGLGGKREREKESDPMTEMVGAIKLLGDGFVRMEQMKMEMAREMEAMRMEMEMKRTEMILESQQRIVEAFAKAFSEKRKKPKRMPSPDS